METRETPVGTPASIIVALFFYAVAIAAPFIGVASVKDSHDGFQIFGTVLISLGLGGIAALVGIVCTIIGMVRGPHTAWTLVAAILALISVALWALALGRMQ